MASVRNVLGMIGVSLITAVVLTFIMALLGDETMLVALQALKEFVAMHWRGFKDFIVAFVRENRQWAAPIVFMLMFLESLAIVSIVVPAVFILVPVVALLGAASIDTALVFQVWLAGGIGGSLGYAISYWVGRWFGPNIEKHWPFYYFPRMFALGRTFFGKYEKSAATAVFLGHFLGPVRGVIPLLAGVFNLRQGMFQTVNVTSSFLQAAAILVAPIYGIQGLEWLLG